MANKDWEKELDLLYKKALAGITLQCIDEMLEEGKKTEEALSSTHVSSKDKNKYINMSICAKKVKSSIYDWFQETGNKTI